MTSEQVKKADGGWRSRKFWYAVGTSCAILAAGVLAAFAPGFRECLSTTDGALLGALGLYAGSNVGAKHVLGKMAPPAPDAPEEPEDRSKR